MSVRFGNRLRRRKRKVRLKNGPPSRANLGKHASTSGSRGRNTRASRKDQVRQPDPSLLPVPDEVLQDTAEPNDAKLDTRSDAARPENKPRSPRRAIADCRINACFLPSQDTSRCRDTRRTRCIEVGAIMGTSAGSKEYRAPSLLPVECPSGYSSYARAGR
jgi:hypothetical protein